MASRSGIVNLLVDCGRGAPNAAARAHLVDQLGRAMAAAGQGGRSVDLSLVDDATIHRLNLEFAGEDHATDVLSFALDEGQMIPGDDASLGDIVIAVPYARRQAQAGNLPLVDELVHLAVHGLCHLLGYDHRTKRQESVMFGYEAELRAVAASGLRSRTKSRAPQSAAATKPSPRTRARPSTKTRRP